MRKWVLIIAAAFFLLSLAAPIFVHSDYTLQILFRVFLFAALGLAWNLVGGYGGQLSLGHSAYFGVGAYGLALFAKIGISPWLALFLGVFLATISAAFIGLVSFRLRGPYFALCTIAFAEVVRLITKNLPDVTGGDVGTQVPLLFTQSSIKSFYISGVLLTVLALAATAWIERSKFGYYLMAIREDEDTAMSVGINTSRVKLWSLLISAAITAMGGALYASLFLFIVPDQVMSIDMSVEIAIIPMLGGAGTLFGPVIGSIVLETAAEIFKNVFQEAHLLIYGALVVVVVMFLPEGIMGALVNKLRFFKRGDAASVEPPVSGVQQEAEKTASRE
jgi:branched-chain amino acid transport system permease protein